MMMVDLQSWCSVKKQVVSAGLQLSICWRPKETPTFKTAYKSSLARCFLWKWGELQKNLLKKLVIELHSNVVTNNKRFRHGILKQANARSKQRNRLKHFVK